MLLLGGIEIASVPVRLGTTCSKRTVWSRPHRHCVRSVPSWVSRNAYAATIARTTRSSRVSVTAAVA